ncbi:MAG: peptidyl-prolyl cis-trans isomerase [Muribaculaceae bacterium]|nr:peptidyl-prolyl cis-trans isomerase [Muribaculaceae bacterium]
MKTKILLGAGLGVCALAWAAKDPVIMKVNGVDVPKSEFEYLYHKNSQQQMAPQPLDEYVEMFVNYRLKVADAMANGVDTTASFRQEMTQYKHDLAAPYLADSVFLNNLVKEACERGKEEVEASHIMIFKTGKPTEDAKAKAFLDSLHKEIKNGADFGELAKQYSQDRGTSQRGGDLGYMVAGRYPYSFEKVAFGMKPGEVSDLTETRMGYHLIKVTGRRPAMGQVRVGHILLMDPKEGGSAALDANKARIDSIYAVAKADPSKFEALAREFSQDPGSARQGGMLPWFGAGQMVPEFETVAFELPNKSLSEPFRSQFGWHIIYKYDAKGAPTLEEMKPSELSRIQNPQDDRFALVRKNQIERLSKKHKGSINKDGLAALKAELAKNGLDSTFYVNTTIDSQALVNIGKKAYTIGDFKATLRGSIQPDKDIALKFVDEGVETFLSRNLVEAEEDWLEANQPEYRNLLHEYRNGSLLYESSVKNVWNRAGQDKEGLESFFQSHRDDYKWVEPRAKGILVQAKNDSVANAIAQRFAELPKAEAVSRLKKEFKGEATVDRILMAKGQNALVDALMFGEGNATPSNSNFTTALILDGRVLTAPEEVEDVKGQVTSDYQEALEEEWISALRKKYPVEIDRKVLKSVK